MEGLVPDTAEYGVWDIPKFVFTCKRSEPGFSWIPQLGDSGFFSFLRAPMLYGARIFKDCAKASAFVLNLMEYVL